VTATPLLEVDSITVEFPLDGHVLRAVDGASFAIAAGERVALVGESGSGKTVTALSIMGLLDPPGRIAYGDIRLDGRSLVGWSEREYRRVRGLDVAMVFQEPMTALNPAQRVGTQVAEAMRVHDPALRRSAARSRVVALFEEVGIADAVRRLRDYPHQLSGGTRQRVLLAMALANTPRLLIADEPTTALDATTQAQILELVDRLCAAHRMAVLLVTHDLAVVAGHADRVVVLYAGRVMEDGPVDAVFARPAHPYTRGLLTSVPGGAGNRERPRVIAGAPPDPRRPPQGCPFHPRCDFAEEQCRSRVPPLAEVGPERASACLRVDEVLASGGE
jgi:oligopeptide/dipeptide ABC transporter ATP-binding protein